MFSTDRELRYHNRICKPSTLITKVPIASSEATQEEVLDVKPISTNNNCNAFVSSVRNPRIDKTHEASVPVQTHSTDITGESNDKGNLFFPKSADCPASTPNKHSNRNTNALPSIQRNKKSKLLLPKPNDPSWIAIDKELDAALPLIFNKKNLACSFSTYCFSFFLFLFSL